MPYVAFQPIPPQFQDSSSVNLSGGSLEFYLAGTSTPTNIYSDNSGTSLGTSVTLDASGYPASGGNVVALYRDTDVDLKVVLKDASDVTLWTSDDIDQPTADMYAILDAGGDFVATSIEAALLEAKGTIKMKTANESKASDTALADDTTLAGWSIAQNGLYLFDAYIAYTQNVGDLKFTFQFSAAPQSARYGFMVTSAAADFASDQDTMTNTQTITTMTDSSENALFMRGGFKGNASGAATMDFQWAQNTSSANNTTLYLGSWIRVMRVA